MKKELNFNSLEAYRRLPEFMSKHHKLIYEAMLEHKYKSYDRFDLAKYISLNPEQIGRRFNEMRKLGLIKLDTNLINFYSRGFYRIRLYGEEADVFKPALSKAERELIKLADLQEETLKALKSEQLEHAVLKEKYKRVEAAHEKAIQVIERYEQLNPLV